MRIRKAEGVSRIESSSRVRRHRERENGRRERGGRERQGDGASEEDQETKKGRDGEKLAAGNGIKSATARPLPGSSRKKLCTCQLLMLRHRILSCAGRFFLSLPLAFSSSLYPLPPPPPPHPARSFCAYFSATGEFSLERFLLQTSTVARERERARERLDLYNERCGVSFWANIDASCFCSVPAIVADISRYFLQVLSRKCFRRIRGRRKGKGTFDKWPIRNSREQTPRRQR